MFKEGKEILEALGSALNRNNKKLFILQKNLRAFFKSVVQFEFVNRRQLSSLSFTCSAIT